MDSDGDQGVTELLARWSDGDEGALVELLPRVYDELRRIAHHYMRKENHGHTLETGALVNEAYLKLIKQNRVSWQNRRHFFAIAANTMRRILINHAEARNAERRGGDAVRVPLDDILAYFDEKKIDLITINKALSELERLDPRQASIVELRFFAGLTIVETAEMLDISAATVKREWDTAKAFLFRALNPRFRPETLG
jgi:RNA polymerase sigma factor (TIGR02999 family)